MLKTYNVVTFDPVRCKRVRRLGYTFGDPVVLWREVVCYGRVIGDELRAIASIDEDCLSHTGRRWSDGEIERRQAEADKRGAFKWVGSAIFRG